MNEQRKIGEVSINEPTDEVLDQWIADIKEKVGTGGPEVAERMEKVEQPWLRPYLKQTLGLEMDSNDPLFIGAAFAAQLCGYLKRDIARVLLDDMTKEEFLAQYDLDQMDD